MWQSAYAEMLFVDTLWPDFSEIDMNAAINCFQQRDRRFGGRNDIDALESNEGGRR